MRELFTCYKFLPTVIAALFALTACGGGGVAEEKITECNFPDDGTTKAPLWVCTENLNNVKLAAVGNYEKTNAGLNFQKQQALAAARVQMAQTFRVNVSNMVKSYAETTGIGDSETVDRVASNTSKQVTNETLVGSRLYRQAKNPETGALFVLAGIGDNELDAALDAILNRSFNASVNNEQAAWQRLQAEKSFDELKGEIKDSYPGGSS